MEKIGLYISFQLGNSFGNISGKEKSTYIYSFSVRQFIWEYIGGKGKSTYIFVFNWAILSGIYKWKKLAYTFVFN